MYTTPVLSGGNEVSWFYDLILADENTLPEPPEEDASQLPLHLPSSLPSDTAPEANILWLLEGIGVNQVPSEEEQLRLAWQVRRGQRGAKALEEATGIPAGWWRRWARARVTGRTPPNGYHPPRFKTRQELLLLQDLMEGEEAFVRMVEGNLKLVVHVAKPLARAGLHLNDLVGYGTIGLMVAVDRYDPSLGHRFSTYAYHWVRKWVIKAAREREEKGRASVSVISLDHPLDEAEEVRQGDLLSWQAVTGSPGPEEAALASREKASVRAALRQIGWLHALVLALRHGLLDGKHAGAEEIAQTLGLPSRVASSLLWEAEARFRQVAGPLNPSL